MQFVLEGGSIDKPLTFDVGLIPVCSPNACKGVFNPNVTIFLSNCANGLHFSAFHFIIHYYTIGIESMIIHNKYLILACVATKEPRSISIFIFYFNFIFFLFLFATTLLHYAFW